MTITLNFENFSMDQNYIKKKKHLQIWTNRQKEMTKLLLLEKFEDQKPREH